MCDSYAIDCYVYIKRKTYKFGKTQGSMKYIHICACFLNVVVVDIDKKSLLCYEIVLASMTAISERKMYNS